MRSRPLLLLVVGLVMCLAASSAAQTGSAVRRVAVLGIAPAAATEPFLLALREGLRERGWLDGRNVVVEYASAQGDRQRLASLASSLAARKVDVIVTGLNEVTAAARLATTRIPIVMVLGVEPVAAGLVASLSKPGGNVTGLTADVTPEIWGKRLQMLKEAAPTVRAVGLIWSPETAGASAPAYLSEVQDAARKLGLALHVVIAQQVAELPQALSRLDEARATAIVVPGDALTFGQRGQIIDFVAAKRWPAIYGSREWVVDGGLMSYGPNVPDLYRRAAGYVDRILRGVPPADLPVARPTKLDAHINLATARRLGLTMPAALVLGADGVIE